MASPGQAARGALLLCLMADAAVTALGAPAVGVVVTNGFELHASLTSPDVTWVLVAANITFSLDTCPFPASPSFPATILDRNVTIASLSPATAAAAAAAGAPLDPASVAAASAPGPDGEAPPGPPYWLNCSHLDGRFQLRPGRLLTLRDVVLVDCRTVETFGLVRRLPGSALLLDNSADDQSPVCLPPAALAGIMASAPRPDAAPLPLPSDAAAAAANGGSPGQLQVLTPPGGNWCAPPGGGSNSGAAAPALPAAWRPTLLAGNASSAGICSQQALLAGNVAFMETPQRLLGSSGGGDGDGAAAPQPVLLQAVRSAALCSQPVSVECVRANGTDACLATAYERVNPDAHPPCPAMDGFGLHNCLTTQSVTRIVLLQDVAMNLSTCPSWLSENPFNLTRDILIQSDPRGPRLMIDCSHMSDRVQLAPGRTLTLDHVIVAHCSIGAEKPFAIVRLDAGSRLVLRDTLLLQSPGACLPVPQQASQALHAARPAGVPGAQAVRLGQPGQWCTASAGTRSPTAGPGAEPDEPSAASDNSSYSPVALPPLPQEYANRTGMGPAFAATLDQPATVPYFVHPTWPGRVLCPQQALLLRDFAEADPFAWTGPSNRSASGSGSNASAAPAAADPQEAAAAAAAGLQPEDAVGGGGYLRASVPVHFINSAWLCAAPSAACAAAPNASARRVCLLGVYRSLNPDLAPPPPPGPRYGLAVVLPAVLASVLGTALLAACVLAGLALRRRHQVAVAKASLGQIKGPQDPAAVAAHANAGGPGGWLGGLLGIGEGATPSGASSANPERRLLANQQQLLSPAGTSDGATPGTNSRSPATSGAVSSRALLHAASPDGIQLSMLLGAGSFGRVYSGTWSGQHVAVKVISHSSEDDTRINRELALSLSFDHPNLVRTLHYARMSINPNSPEASLGTPSAGGSSLFLPEGAVGVFSLPSTWAVIQQRSLAGPGPMVDSELWLVMDLMDRGNLAVAVRQGAFTRPDGTLRAASLLRRCADIAAGVAYLHARNVCHGDLKCENVLLRSEPQDPDGILAAVADFGLSRALAFGQSHLSTRRYGTVTHQPPELLVAGKLTPAADCYSFGIMMWEVVSRTHPFAGLHHGEVIHRVVTQDLRPGPWPPAQQLGLLPAGYIELAEACWARQASARPTMQAVLQQLLALLAEAEAGGQ